MEEPPGQGLEVAALLQPAEDPLLRPAPEDVRAGVAWIGVVREVGERTGQPGDPVPPRPTALRREAVADVRVACAELVDQPLGAGRELGRPLGPPLGAEREGDVHLVAAFGQSRVA
jgi:hypothetical protein